MEAGIILGAWALKELYQSFKGARAETLKGVAKANREISVLQSQVLGMSERIKDLNAEIRAMRDAQKRYYR